MEEPVDLTDDLDYEEDVLPADAYMESVGFDVTGVQFRFVGDVFVVDISKAAWENTLGVAVKLDQEAVDAVKAAVAALAQAVDSREGRVH